MDGFVCVLVHWYCYALWFYGLWMVWMDEGGFCLRSGSDGVVMYALHHVLDSAYVDVCPLSLSLSFSPLL